MKNWELFICLEAPMAFVSAVAQEFCTSVVASFFYRNFTEAIRHREFRVLTQKVAKILKLKYF
jgi:hypothetical protein